MSTQTTFKPVTDKQRRFIVSLRQQLGIEDTAVPETSREAARLIGSLLRRRTADEHEKRRRAAAEAPPGLDVVDAIEAVAGRLGVVVEVPETAGEARRVLDDLRHRERQSWRTADGTAG